MSARLVKFVLGAVAAGCLLTAAAVVYSAGWRPLDLPRGGAGKAAAAAGDSAAAPQLSDLTGAWERPLRRPLSDADISTPAATQVAAIAPPMPPLHVAGTVVEPGHSAALIAAASGQTLKHVGDDVDGATIIDIREDAITVKWNGGDVVVPVERAGAPAASRTSSSAPDLGNEDRR